MRGDWLDGAHAGLTIVQALRIILGREKPTDDWPRMTRDEMRDYLMSADDDPSILRGYLDEPCGELGNLGAEATYEQVQRARLIDGLLVAITDQAVPRAGESATYELVARAMGKRYLCFMLDNPADAEREMFLPWADDQSERTFNDAYEEAGFITRDLDPTGFQAGWAANAAKYVLGLPPVRNPALATFSG